MSQLDMHNSAGEIGTYINETTSATISLQREISLFTQFLAMLESKSFITDLKKGGLLYVSN